MAVLQDTQLHTFVNFGPLKQLLAHCYASLPCLTLYAYAVFQMIVICQVN